MGMKPNGKKLIKAAKKQLETAKTVQELRQAQAVIFPLKFKFSMNKTGEALGISRGWVCQLRQAFIKSGGKQSENKKSRGGRRRENMSLKEETEFLLPFFEKAKSGGILVVGEIKQALDKKLDRKTALSSVYYLLHRHNWRKLAPDKRHIKTDVAAQENWKKNSQKSSTK